MKVHCQRRIDERPGENGAPAPVTVVECSRCDNSAWAWGRHDRSKRRALADLSDSCPRDESNYYEVA